MANKKSGFGKFLLGIGLGAGLGMLFAPKSGSETRSELKNKINKLLEEAKEIDIQEVKDEFFKKIEEIKLQIEDLDKEKVLKIAKEKTELIKEKTKELIELAKEKGTPVLENAADEVRKKAIEVTKEVLNKLEK